MRLGLLVLALVPALALAQPDRDGSRRGDDGRAGRVAVVGSVPWESLSSFPPPVGSVGVRYWASDRTIVGGALGLSVSSSNGASDRSSVRGALWVERHLGRRRGPVSPFVIVELDAAQRDGPSYYAYPDCIPDAPCPPVWGGETRETSLGASVGAGAEVRVLRGLTLSGGYRVRLAGERITYPGVPGWSVDQDLDLVTLDTGAADLRLSIYF